MRLVPLLLLLGSCAKVQLSEISTAGDDWVEIQNVGRRKAALVGWTLSDDPADPQKWPIPDLALGAGERRILRPSFGLSADGERIQLYGPNADPMDTMDVPPLAVGRTYGRSGEKKGQLAWPTPGGENAPIGPRPQVRVSHESGHYPGPMVVTATAAIGPILWEREGAPPVAQGAGLSVSESGSYRLLAKVGTMMVELDHRTFVLGAPPDERHLPPLFVSTAPPEAPVVAWVEAPGQFLRQVVLRPQGTGRPKRSAKFQVDDQRYVLRGGNNDTFRGELREDATYLRDRFVRDTQIAMSGVGAVGRFVHLYVAAKPWGIYELVERPERAKDLTQPLDDLQFADYLLLQWYAGVGDGLDRNWFAILRSRRLQVMAWDAEYALVIAPVTPTSSDRARVHPAFLPGTRENARYGDTQIVRWWAARVDRPTFRAQLRQRAAHHCGGALSDASARARWDGLVTRIRPAIPAEARRWGHPEAVGQFDEATGAVRSRLDQNCVRLLKGLQSLPPVRAP